MTMVIDKEQAQLITVPKVFEAINAVQRELAITGIAKNKKVTNGNGNGNYKFRGIDDIYNALSVLMAKHNLIISPRFVDRNLETRVGGKGYTLFFTTLTGHFDFISCLDGSKHTVTTYGEAMDSGDKGTNKAMSIAYKYACFQLFAIPTEATAIDPDDHVYPKDKYTEVDVTNSNSGAKNRSIEPQLLPAPISAMALNIDGKMYDEYNRRIFDATQFKSVILSVQQGIYPLAKFTNDEKYCLSNEQLNALLQLDHA